MAEESSSIALQFTIQMRGLTKVTQLNAALKDLKTNVIGVQKGIKEGAANLKSMGAGATSAAKGMKDLSRANEEFSRGSRSRDMLGKDIARIQKQQADAAKRAAADVARATAKTNDHMAKTFRDAQVRMVREQQASARERAKTEEMYARLFDQQEKATVRSAQAAQSKIVAQQRKAEAQRTAIAMAESRKRAAQEERDARRHSQHLRVRLSAWEEHYDAIFRAGFRLQMVGNDLRQLGRYGVDALRGISEEFANFEFMINRAAGATGLMVGELDGGVDIYGRFTQQIQAASQQLRFFKPEEVAKATYFWASTSGQQIDSLQQLESVMRSVNPLMKIAAMTETDYETAIKGVYSILIQYGLGLDEVQQVTEKLHMVTQRTAAEFPDLINSFKMVGPVAKEFGVSFDEMVILLGRLADAGIRGTMSGRAFRQFFIQISKPSGPAKKALDALWESTQQFGDGRSYLETVFPKGEFIGVNEYVNVLANRMQNLDTKTRMFTLASITTANELPVLTALVAAQIKEIKGLGDGWDYTKENLETAAESFASSWEMLRSSWKGTLGALSRGVEIIRLKVGKQLADILAPTFERFVAVLVNVREWFEDANNGPIIEFGTRLLAISSAALIVAGSIAVFGGAIVGLVAVLKVIWGAFAPLTKAFSVAGGVVAAFAVALIRNFDYIKETVTEVFTTLSGAIQENEDAVAGLAQAFGVAADLIGRVMDTVIRVLGEFAKVAATVAAAVLGNEEAMKLLGFAANALGFIIAGRLLMSMGRLVQTMVFGNRAALALRGGLLALIVPTKVLGGTGPGGIAGLSGGFKAFVAGGWITAALAATAVAVGYLYTTNERVRGGIDRLIFEWVTGLEDVERAADEARLSMGQFTPELDAAIGGSPEYKALLDDVKNLEELTSGGDNIIDFQERMNLKSLDTARKQLAQYKTDVVNTMQDVVQELNNYFGADVTFEEYISRLSYEANRLGTTITDVKAKSATWDYFRNVAADAKEANARAAELVATLEMTPTAVPGISDILNSKRVLALGELGELQAGGQLEGETANAVQTILNNALEQGVLGAGVTEEVAATMWSDLARNLINSAKGMKDFDKNLKEALKESVNPASAINAIFKSTETGLIQSGFMDMSPSQRAIAIAESNQAWGDIKGLIEGQLNLNSMTGVDSSSFIGSLVNNFESDLTSKFDPSVPQSVIETMKGTVEYLYEQAGIPIPQDVIDAFNSRGVDIVGTVVTGLESATPSITEAGKLVPGAYAAGVTSNMIEINRANKRLQFAVEFVKRFATNNAYTWGKHFTDNFARGLKNPETYKLLEYNVGQIADTVHRSLGFTVPEEGVLRDADVWGQHFVEGFAGSMMDGLPELDRSVTAMAESVALARDMALDTTSTPSMSFETSANRTMKLQVEVTSPDGSVDRVKAAEFERALMSNDLIMSIEHMATVG